MLIDRHGASVGSMNVTKYEHSCLVVSKGSAKLVIDPGSFLATLPETSGVVGIVITHEHADHFSADRVQELLTQNPWVTGMKTGYTNAAGRCLVSSAGVNGRHIIVVVLGCHPSRIWTESENLIRWALGYAV